MQPLSNNPPSVTDNYELDPSVANLTELESYIMDEVRAKRVDPDMNPDSPSLRELTMACNCILNVVEFKLKCLVRKEAQKKTNPFEGLPNFPLPELASVESYQSLENS